MAQLANQRNHPPADELVGQSRQRGVPRRDFLRAMGLAGVAAGTGAWLPGCTTARTGPHAPRIVIVGGGVAGLNAAYKLKQHGWHAVIYEASSRTGGRIYTGQNILNRELTTELGGEFIDSGHEEMLKLVAEFGLELIDVQGPGEKKLAREAFYFDGAHHDEAEVVEAFRPFAAQIQADKKKAENLPAYERELDGISLADYFDRIQAQGWVRKLLDTAFLTEYGLECGEQSSLNMIYVISTDVSRGRVDLFGDSDERYKVRGGNQCVVDELARRVPGQIQLRQRLVAISPHGRGYTLTFEQDGRQSDVAADFVILTLPFTLLRDVDLRVELPGWKKKAIQELGYGMNAKLMLGTRSRLWRDRGYSGNIFSDEAFQLAWDNSRLQGGTAGGITCYTGGKASDRLKDGPPHDQAARMLAALEKPYPGITAQFNGKAERFHWPTHPFTRASYACYRPGQWTTIAGNEGKPVGNLFFAGEHCSRNSQGFMNGGAETGASAAAGLMRVLRKG